MTERQFTDLETRIAHQEHTISQLDAVVTRQQDQIDKLEASLELLARRCLESNDGGSAAPTELDEVPPHY